MTRSEHKDLRGGVAFIATLIAVLCVPGLVSGQVLDKQEILDRFSFWYNKDWDWYKENIPFFESPDTDIDMTYYYRWEMMSARMVYGSGETGYVSTEFTDRPWWSGTYGAISCAAGHQLYEYRWFRNPRYFEDYARYWFRTPGAQPRNYSAWIADAIWQGYQVYRDEDFVVDLRGDLVRNYQGWEHEHWVAEEGMFAWDGMHDGMETNINSRLTDDWFAGAPGYRPTLNSYMWANANAISNISLLMGDRAGAELFSRKADTIKRNLLTKTWDPDRNFFFHRFQHDERGGIKANTLTYETGPYAGSNKGRELHGYVPWYFRLPDVGYESAWQYITDSAYFFSAFGPTTVEKGDPLFKVAENCCEWSGNAWPFATAQTLKAMANVIKYYPQDYIDKDDYFRQFKIFALTHRKDGMPYIAEANHPETGSWSGHDHAGHSEHYFHSAYIDEVITGLVGLTTSAGDSVGVEPLVPDHWDFFALDDVYYHGHYISVLWDRYGTRYQHGKGLFILADGNVIAHAPKLEKLTAALAPKTIKRQAPLVNYAVNNEKQQRFPQAIGSYPGIGEQTLQKLVDGQHWYYRRTPNEWSSVLSDNDTEWVGVDFGGVRPVQQVAVYFVEGEGIQVPASYHLEYWHNDEWRPLDGGHRPSTPQANRANIIRLDGPVDLSKLRVVMESQAGHAIAVSELEAWGPPVTHDLPLVGNPLPGFSVSASYTSTFDRVETLEDGIIDKNLRWTAFESPNAADWIQLDFSKPENIAGIYLYFFSDNNGVVPPTSYEIQYFDGSGWQSVNRLHKRPKTPIAGLNQANFEPIPTQQLRIVVTHAGDGKYSGLYGVQVVEK